MSRVLDLINSHLRALEGYAAVDPTEVLAQQAGIPPDQVLRLHANENPYGPSPRVVEALARFDTYHLYPDPQQRRVRTVLADYLGVEAERIVCGNGSDELIDLVLRLCLAPSDTILEPTPTFGMYSFCATVCGGRTISVPRDAAFEVDVEAVRTAVLPNTKAIFITSPNNPTGNPATEAQVRQLLELGPFVVVDETYHEFCGQTVLPLVREYPNLIVLRTLSKWAGLAGLRVGYGIMAPELLRIMLAMKPPYNISAAAEVALMASLEDRQYLLGHVRAMVQERDRMAGLLAQVPEVKPLPSSANFILVQCPTGMGKKVYEGLARRGVFVRYFSHPRLRDCVRISVGLPAHTNRVITAFRDTLGTR